MIRRSTILAAVLIAALGASGCSTVSNLNPFGKKDKGPAELAGEGQRISIIPADQILEPAAALKGVDFALPPAETVAAWPLPGGNTEQAVGNVAAGANLSVAWRKNFGQGQKRGRYITAPPVAAEGKLFLMDADARVVAVDAASGAQIWRTATNPGDNKRDKLAFGGGVAYADGKLYVSSGFREVMQMDAKTGAVGWRTKTPESIHGAPNVSGGRVFVVSLDNTLMTFDAATGAASWTYQALTETARILSASSPAVSGDTVVAAFGSGELVALRATNGNDLWNEALSRASRTSALSEIRDIPGRPVIYQGDVFAVSHSGVFAATDLRTGQARWTLPVVGVTAPWPAGDVVYVVSKSGDVICASRENGQIYWIRNLNEGFKAKKVGGILGVGGQRQNKPVWSGPLLAGERLLIVGQTGQLVALNAKTGEIQTRVDLKGASTLSPIAMGDTVYVVTEEADLIAIR
ncbi:MAG: PQQ-binding-like beta-propeller repeat protein [Alphaproteobacteria bacterium]|nr:PQQ-binding-like beta-propeller repeat protein [Alphaproteobacteria bacterium]MBU1513891.1 PQQ-binding-like beta-propeller repeat protein [Alphaproteobacteria bacterium]MBU2094464.1 PQQ-binding-like beta-propeller repeat protein [Alphaproteobacteria bacterium]MBU2149810.1 PQQ-binding-like beta-propeller repeat protein [Alphaproteobacteria bacterium]MBU2307281.1 PQQ-binding-like beta-propeller repeat protein [Alphaproteobacteria bacterium]